MRITMYGVEFNNDKQNVLVKENAVNYACEFKAFDQPEKIVRMMNDIFRMNKKSEEYAYILALNTKTKLLGVFELSHGTVDMSLVSTREIFIRLLLSGATGFVLVHNHPSGDCEPSHEDILVTKKVKDSGKLIGINLLDHIIIGDEFYSFCKEDNL